MDIFKFESLANASKKYSRGGVPGMTLTVYAGKASLSEDLWQALGCPDRVDLVKEESRGMLFIDCVETEGYPITQRKDSHSRMFGDASIKNELNRVRPYDWRNNFLRFTGGKSFRNCWCFSLDDDVTEVAGRSKGEV